MNHNEAEPGSGKTSIGNQSYRQNRAYERLVQLVSLLVITGFIFGIASIGTFYINKYEVMTAVEQPKPQERVGDHNANLEAENAFMQEYNNAQLSNQMCVGKPLYMADVHITSKFVTFRYYCAEDNYTGIDRIGAFQKYPDNTYKFTYGSTTSDPDALPGYIFDTDPDYFSEEYYAVRF